MKNQEIEKILEQIDFDQKKIENNTLYLKLKEKVNTYIVNALKKSKNHSGSAFLKNLENKIDGKWVFQCFEELFCASNNDYRPIYVVSHYRGLLFTNAKETSSFAPANELKKAEFDLFRKKYELVQGDGRHTLNTLLAYYVEEIYKRKQLFFCCCFDQDTMLDKKYNWINLKISPEIYKVLLGEEKFATEIKNLGENENEKNKIKNKLQEHRNRALYNALCGYNKIDEILRELLSQFSNVIFNINKDDTVIETEKRKIWLEILQVLQGVCIFLDKFGESLFVLLSREIDTKTSSSCIGEFFVFEKNSTKETFHTFIKNISPIVDGIQRYYFETVLESIPPRDKDVGRFLGYALQSRELADGIVDSLEDKVFNFDSLAGVIRLAQVISPAAIHEGKSLNITFIIGYPSLLKDKLISTCEFNINDEDKGENENEVIQWHIPAEKTGTSENEALHKAKSRIIGNCLILQKSNVALFVDCNEEKPTCNHVVEPYPFITPGISQESISLTDIIEEIDDAFLVRIIGQKRIEIFHKKEKILVRSHSATWEKENTWDDISIKKFLCKKFSLADNHEKIKIIAETAYRISQTMNEGASFVICRTDLVNKDEIAPTMTLPFPNLGKGVITDSENLKTVATEDGGVLINITRELFYGRRQWLPYDKNNKGIPFCYKNFNVPLSEDDWKKTIAKIPIAIKSGKEAAKHKKDIYEIPTMKPPPKLYEICKYKFLKYNTNYIKNPWYWDSWYKVLSWGTRHISCMGMSACLWDAAVVVVVSVDSNITVFYEGIEQKPLE